jgi:hypothetical protein
MGKKVLALALSVALFASAEVGFSWSERGSALFMDKAIEALSGPLDDFYKNRKTTLIQTVSDPSRFGSRMPFEVDRLEAFPFDELPADRKLAIRKYGEAAIEEAGDVPWRLIESYQALVEAFRESDFDTALSVSAEIAFYVGEMYVPVNVSKNGDGEPTGQHGLRERFDSRLLEAYSDKLDVETPSAIYLDRPEEYAVSIPRKSYIWVDNILYFDYLSRMGVESYDRFYYEGMWLRAEPLLEQLLRSAALDTASFWYTAWVVARKPELPKS